MLGVHEVEGKHSGKNLAAYFLDILQSFGVQSKLYCIAADNASNNLTLAKEIESKFALFKAEQNLLGCVGHVLNLAAKAGLKFLQLQTDTVDALTESNNNMV